MRSHVGASGLMQVMPATARWTAKKIGLTGFTPDQISTATPTSPSAPLTSSWRWTTLQAPCPWPLPPTTPPAAPQLAQRPGAGRRHLGRKRALCRNARLREEVLANTTNYAALLTGQPQSLRSRLGTVGPRDAASPVVNADLP